MFCDSCRAAAAEDELLRPLELTPSTDHQLPETKEHGDTDGKPTFVGGVIVVRRQLLGCRG